MVGGAMFPQCLPRRSADSLSPSRISMKSYLGGDSRKGHRWKKDHSEDLGRTIILSWLSPFFYRHSGVAERSTKGAVLALVHRQTQTQEVALFKLQWMSAWVGGLISCSHESNCIILSGSQSKHCVFPWVAVAYTFHFHCDLSNLCLSLTLPLQVTKMCWAWVSSNVTGGEK